METNFLMSVCTGRAPLANELLDADKRIEIVIPLVCFMEARKAFRDTKADKLTFKQPFQSQIKDVGRDPDAHAQQFARMLAAADTALVRYLDQSEQRLNKIICETVARVRLLVSSPGILKRSVHSYLADPTDDMVAGSIIEDALLSPADKMAFFSEDGDFAKASLVDAMMEAGIERLDEINSCLAWCRA